MLMALAGMVPLASMQLWPTLQLARLSESHRDFEYLSGFAATPFHLVNYLAPGLFHRSPLWRPLAWDTFHTSPEELLGYVGLAPIFLALGAIRRNGRGDPGVKALAIVAALTLILSFGPYFPGFAWLIRLPGFSFFRAPARWGLATNLALALLAGRGFDACSDWPKVGRGVGRFVLASTLVILSVIVCFEVALMAAKGGAGNPVSAVMGRVLGLLPWSDRAESRSFLGVMAEAHRSQFDLRTRSSLARLEGQATPAPGPSLAGDRFAIYRLELLETGVLLVGLLAVGALSGRPRAFGGALLAITLVDGLIQSRHRSFDLGPARPLVQQSPVLAKIAREARGSRTLDSARNLFLVAGASPVSAYRTLDLPSPGPMLRVAGGPTSDPKSANALRAAGVDLRVLDPEEARNAPPEAFRGWSNGGETIRDPALAGWLLGEDLARSLGWQDFRLVRAREPGNRAWLLPSKGLRELDAMGDPFAIGDRFRTAIPLPYRSEAPERVEVEVKVFDANRSMVILSTTFDPEWRGWWLDESEARRPAAVVRVLGGWQGVEVPGPGKWTLHLEYPGRAVWLGLAIASTAWSFWLMGFIRTLIPSKIANLSETPS